MTLAAVWIEDRGSNGRPLCFATDSRTLPGPIEGVTKTTLFARRDLVGVWAGDYRYASLLMSHLDAVFDASDAMRRRDVDVGQALAKARASIYRHLTTALTTTLGKQDRIPSVQRPSQTCIVVGGYSILNSSHMVLRIDYTEDDKRWRASVGKLEADKVIFVGDDKKRARSFIVRSRKLRKGPGGWRMEPLAAILDACEDPRRRSIGGEIQLVKNYMHGEARAYGLRNSKRGPDVTIRGTVLDARSARELESAGLVIDLAEWSAPLGSFIRTGSGFSGSDPADSNDDQTAVA